MSDDFLSRWSRLKRRAEVPERQPALAQPDLPLASTGTNPDAIDRRDKSPEMIGPVDAAGPDPSIASTAEEIAALPSLDDLNATSDLGPFLRAGVPSTLRNAALKRMWSLDPGIRDFVSEAREYAYDWNSPGGVPGLGPMLASDDVKAMMRRIFEGPTVGPASDEVANAERADPEAWAPEQPPDERSREGAPPITAAGPSAETIAEAKLSLEACEAETAPPPAGVASEPIPGLRMRRHGGALPS